MRKVIMKAMIFLLSFLLIIMYNKNMYAKEDVNVNAQSYILMESSSKRVLCGKNINNKYLTASICKIMTAIIIIERCNIDDYVLIDETTTLQEGSKVYLKQNDLIRIRDLLYGLLLRSGNDCAYLLAKSCCKNVEDFVVLMNQYAKEIGMNNTIFNNPSGLDNSDSNYSTAYDMALLMSYAMQNEVFKEINQTTKYSFSTASDVKYTFYNKHKLINGYDYVIGGKTGVAPFLCEI